MSSKRNWNDVDFRSYKHIFVNANQSSPGDNIKLGYVSPYIDITFEPGEDKEFHFPLVPKEFKYSSDIRYTSGLPIQDSGLVESGAIPGYAPYCSDRIYMNNVDYEWMDSGGGARPRKLNNGVWLCSWLSGGATSADDAKWVDRWYDPDIILRSEAEVYRSVKDSDDSDAKAGIYDVDSRMTFRYGCQYLYHRVSKSDLQFFVDLVDANGLVLRINDWTSAGCYNSASATSAISTIRMNNTTPDMFDSCSVVDGSGDKGVAFNGKSVITVDTDKTNRQGAEFSIVGFMQHDDWKNSPKGGIVDRGIHGGWEVGVSPVPYNNLICVLGTEKQTNQSSISIYGPSFNFISTAKFSSGQEVVCAAVDDDYNVWGLRRKDIVRIDMNANITRSCVFPDAMASWVGEQGHSITDVTLHILGGDFYGKMAVVCGNATEMKSEAKKETETDAPVFLFDLTECTFDSHIYTISDFSGRDNRTGMDGINSIVTNSAGNGLVSWLEPEWRFGFYRRHSAYDIDDELVNPPLPLLIFDDDEIPFNIKVDGNGNIFAMTRKYAVIGYDVERNPAFYKDESGKYHTNLRKILDDGLIDKCEICAGRLIKFIKDRDGHFYVSKIVNLPVYDWSKPSGIVISAYNKNEKNVTVVNAVMSDGYIIRYSTDLDRLWTTNISYYSDNIRGIYNGYEWGRKFMNNVLYARVLIGPEDEVLKNPGKRYLLTYDIVRGDKGGHSKGLSDRDWHQFAFIRSGSGFSLYLDSEIADRVDYTSPSHAKWKLMYVADPNIVIGGDCGVGAELYEEHNMMDLFWNGKFDDLRIYNTALSQWDLSYIHICKYDVQPLHWNIKIYDRYYVETIDRVFKMKMPGSKSQNYDVVVNGYDLPGGDTNEFLKIKGELSDYIKGVLPEIAPAYSQNGRVVFKSKNDDGRIK